MEKIRILQIGFSYKIGGIEVFALNSMSLLDKNKFDIYFINVFEKAKKENFYQQMKDIGTVFDLSDYRKKPVKFLKEFIKLNKKYKFDVVHYNMASAVYLLPIIAAKICGVKNIITHAHNNASDKGIIKSFIHNVNKLFIPIFANRYFACSDSAANWFYTKKIMKNDKCIIINNSVDVDKFKYDEQKRKEIRKKLGIPINAKVYGHVGSFKAIKNHAFLIDIFKKLYDNDNNSYLILIGNGPLMDEIKQKVTSMNIDKNVMFLGQRENVSDYSNAMDAFILPSINEGLGIVLIEAQANGLPCFVSNNIPIEAEINDNFYRLSLKKDAEYWGNYIICTELVRSFSEKIYKYDININSNILSEYYEKFNKIKVCHFVYGIKHGGVEKVLLNYFSRFNMNEYEIHILSQGSDDSSNVNEFEQCGFVIHNVTKKSESVVKNYAEIRKILLDEKFDIVHCHMSITNFFPLLYSKLFGVKIRINHSHNAMMKKSFPKKILSKMGMLFDTHRMACSKDAAKWLFNSTKNVKILYNALEVERYQYSKDIRQQKRKELKLKDSDIVLGCVGRLENQKNQQFIISVLEELLKKDSNYKLLLVGIGQNESMLKQMANEKKISKNIMFLGSRTDVNDLYQAFDIFVLPSLYEGLGIVYVEAQISGLKCLASKYVPIDTKITDNIVFLDLNQELWVKEIESWSNNHRKSYVEEAIRGNYDINKEAEKLDVYYKKIINKLK